jgi:sortase B
MKKWTARIMMLVCVAVFLFSSYNLLDIFQSYREAENLYEDTADEYMTVAAPDEKEELKAPIEVDFTDILKINQDVIGWIYMEDTVVNYPVLQGENNLYYLDKTYYKKYLASGSIYLDSDNERDFSDAHCIIYGHNMKNHTMFGDLSDFRDEEYLKNHPYVDLILVDGTWLRYEIFSLYRAHVDDGTYRLPLNIEKNFKPFMELVNEKNMFADADSLNLPAVKTGDKVLTLSTCTEDSADLERFVVHALLVSVDGRDVSDADSQVEQ